MKNTPKLLIIGIDGANFNLINAWVATGDLPNIKKLVQLGVHGDLTSTIPPVTAPAWTSFMTGKNPGKHNLYNFIEAQPDSYSIRYTNTRTRLSDTIWRALNKAGHRVGVINVPMTFPPEPVDGFMISGLDAPGDSPDCVYPRDLYGELAEKFGAVNRQMVYLGNLQSPQQRESLLRELEEIDLHYLKLTKYLWNAHPVDVMMLVFTSTDTVQHFFWHYLDPSHHNFSGKDEPRFRDAILTTYKRIDSMIGELFSLLPADASLAIMSDHGFAPTSGREIRVNRFLEEIGVLTRLDSHSLPFHPRAVFRKVVRTFDRVLRGHLTPAQKTLLAKCFPNLRVKWEAKYTGLSSIDWARTKAFSYEMLSLPLGIWINTKGSRPQGTVAPGEEYRNVVDFIMGKLLAIKDPKTDAPLIAKVYRKEEVYQGPFLDQAPDLILGWWEGVTFTSKPSFGNDDHEKVVTDCGDQPIARGGWSGTHSMDGILLLKGDTFRQGLHVQGAGIADFAPTLLHLLHVPIPDDMDGKVLTDVFTDKFLAQYPLRFEETGDGTSIHRISDTTYSHTEEQKIADRLRDLGYLD